MRRRVLYKDYTGQQCGFLFVLYWCGMRLVKSGADIKLWYCRCSCGKEIIRTSESLHRPNNSCGCVHKEARRQTALVTLAKRNEERLKQLSNLSIEYSFKPKKRGRLRKTIREKVFLKHGDQCLLCGLKDNNANNIDTHHLKAHSEHPKYRMMVVNMIPLCKKCHTRLHKALGWVNVPVMAQIQFIKEHTSIGGLNHTNWGLSNFSTIVSSDPTATIKAFFLPGMNKIAHIRTNSAYKELINSVF